MLDFSSLNKAILSYNNAINVAKSQMANQNNEIQDTIRAGVIQNFEFTFELCWKFMKRWLENNLGNANVDGVSRRELFRLAAEHQLIDNVDDWMDYHEKRNETSHTYDRTTAQEVFETSLKFIIDAQKLLVNLEKRNG